MDRGALTDSRVDDLKEPVLTGYTPGDSRTKNDWDGFSMWQDHPRFPGKNGWAGYINCAANSWRQVLSEMYELPGKDLYLYRKDCKTCWPGAGGVCQPSCPFA